MGIVVKSCLNVGDYASKGSRKHGDEVIELPPFLSSYRYHFVMLIAVFYRSNLP